MFGGGFQVIRKTAIKTGEGKEKNELNITHTPHMPSVFAEIGGGWALRA